MFALVDCNNFYASCERVFNPKWIGKPIVVLSNNDGCIIARSNEAKSLGIPMGAPFFKYKKLIEAHDVIVCSSNYTLYGDMSSRVMRILKDFSPDMQVYSIDEAFLMMQAKNLRAEGMEMRRKVLQWTGIPVSIGMGATKTLAKAANRHAKKYSETGGVFILNEQPQTDQILDSLPVAEIWGIGRKSAEKLNRKGIVTAKEFRDAEDGVIRKLLSVAGLRIALELRGISCLPLQEIPAPKKSITCSRAFGKPVDKLEELHEAVAFYAARASERMREQDSLASSMIVFVELHPFDPAHSGSFHTRVIFPEPTDYAPHLISYAKKAAKELFKAGLAYRKAGIILEGLVPYEHYQKDLFAQPFQVSEKQRNVMKIIDAINADYGRTILHSAAEGVGKPWKMKRSLCSPTYTTGWDGLLAIKI